MYYRQIWVENRRELRRLGIGILTREVLDVPIVREVPACSIQCIQIIGVQDTSLFHAQLALVLCS